MEATIGGIGDIFVVSGQFFERWLHFDKFWAGPSWSSPIEGFDRGLYDGPIGLFDGLGHDVAVAIRSLRLSPEMATLFAGAGIVRDSQPEMEFVETEAKLAVARAALPGTG